MRIFSLAKVTLVENDRKRAKFASDNLDCIVVPEEGHRREALLKAGIQRAEHFVAVTDSDEVNIITCAAGLWPTSFMYQT
ncbi:MAG: NAD-binding protein [Spirochaetales bacterium]|nr:NAD-binding protein [Spirochaetales bacterium]